MAMPSLITSQVLSPRTPQVLSPRGVEVGEGKGRQLGRGRAANSSIHNLQPHKRKMLAKMREESGLSDGFHSNRLSCSSFHTNSPAHRESSLSPLLRGREETASHGRIKMGISVREQVHEKRSGAKTPDSYYSNKK